jgi:NitT/TauT family transport system permease protein
MNPTRLPRPLRFLLPVLMGAAVVALWYLANHLLAPERRFLLPRPDQILDVFSSHGADLWRATRWSATAALGGFGLAVAASVLFALLLAWADWVRASLYPYLMMLQMTPIIIIAPILTLWVGPGLPSVVIVTFLICFFPMVVNNTQGLLSTDPNLVDLFRMAKASRWQQMMLLRTPSALPYFFSGMRIAAVLAPIGALTGDYQVGSTYGGKGGLGIQALIYNARSEIPALYATALIGCALGFVFVGAVLVLSWFALHRWHDSYHREG